MLRWLASRQYNKIDLLTVGTAPAVSVLLGWWVVAWLVAMAIVSVWAETKVSA